jgi:hypothetical protein
MNEYSLIKICKNDPGIPSFFVMTVVFIIYGLQVYYIGFSWNRRNGFHIVPIEERLDTLIFFGIIALACIIYILYRFYTVINLFNIGQECNGIIDKIKFVAENNRWEISFIYNFENNEYYKTLRLTINKENEKYKIFDKITVLVDPYETDTTDRRVIIKDFYVKK